MTAAKRLENTFFVLLMLVDFGYIGIAVYFLDSCPKGQMLPLYNIVSAVYNIVAMYFGDKWSKCFSILSKILEGALLAAGSYWTYEIYLPDFVSETSADYCHQTFYAFCLFTIPISSFIFVTSLLFELCIKRCSARQAARRKPAPPEPEEAPPVPHSTLPPPLRIFTTSFVDDEDAAMFAPPTPKPSTQKLKQRKPESKKKRP
ncbi:transmembrane protein 272-like [Scyliorhinus canicula]|uniref:transmembrane protein 272-like n=1 Tax=Scyliorhinus canicula TaxID=7830 RepID=UPI0018F5E7B7|nr:transmembrane protein 272-like [Scyliorhinus canicula]